MRLRQIWAEGTFVVLKYEHKLNKIQGRELQKTTEECLLPAKALNLKKMIKAAQICCFTGFLVIQQRKMLKNGIC